MAGRHKGYLPAWAGNLYAAFSNWRPDAARHTQNHQQYFLDRRWMDSDIIQNSGSVFHGYPDDLCGGFDSGSDNVLLRLSHALVFVHVLSLGVVSLFIRSRPIILEYLKPG